MVSFTGIDVRTFNELAVPYERIWRAYSPHVLTKDGRMKKIKIRNSGRARQLTAKASLGLVLTWLRNRGAFRTLCFLYGIIPR